MSLSSTTNRASYIGDGSSATFSFPYYFFKQTDLNVYLFDTLSGGVAQQALNTNFTISGSVNAQGLYPNGGNVVMASAIVSTTQIVITRAPSPVQNFVLQQNGLIPSTALTQQLDYLTLLAQRSIDLNSSCVRFSDGFNGAFNPVIPGNIIYASNLVLAMNSSATGFAFQSIIGAAEFGPIGLVLTGNGSSAISSYQAVSLTGSSVTGTLSLSNGGTGGITPQTWGVVYASSATQLATSNPGPSGLALISNASSAPTFQALNLSSGAVTGVLPEANGGTGIGITYPQYGVIYASSANALSAITAGSSGLVLLTQGSSAPIFGAVSLSGSGVSGVLPALNGGTGTGAAFTQYGVPYASSGTQLAIVPAGSSGLVFMTQGSSAPVFGAVNLSGAGVTGTLGSTNGGTGNPGPYSQYGVAYASTSTVLSTIVNGTSGQVLTSNGSSAPSYQAVSVTTNVVTKTATYAATTSDNVIILNSTNFFINLYTAAGNTGKQITIIKTDKNDVVNAGFVTIIASSASSSIQGSSFQIGYQYEMVALVCDGTNWQIQSIRKNPTITRITTLGIGTYQPPAGCVSFRAKLIGGGGAGGGTSSGATTGGAGGGGGGGGYTEKFFYNSSVSSVFTLTIGAGGLAGVAGTNPGTNGSSTVFATTYIANGGVGGSGGAGTTTPAVTAAGGAGGTGSGGDLNISGGTGLPGMVFAAGSAIGGKGGDTRMGFGPAGILNGGTGSNGANYGTGGSGGSEINNGSAVAGGPGNAGIIEIEENYI